VEVYAQSQSVESTGAPTCANLTVPIPEELAKSKLRNNEVGATSSEGFLVGVLPFKVMVEFL